MPARRFVSIRAFVALAALGSLPLLAAPVGSAAPGGPSGQRAADPSSVTAAALPVLFDGVAVVTMARPGEVLADRAVLVSGGRIAAIGAAGELELPAGGLRIDGHGAYLLPGLVDLHVHPWTEHDLTLLLAHGVTRALVPGGPALGALPWRDASAAGALLAPALHVCADSIGGVEDVAEARRLVEETAELGYDCIKVYDDLSAEVFGELTASARRLGLPSIAHIPRNLGWQDMLAAAPSAVAHAEEFLYSPCCSAEDRERIVTTMRDRGIALITTLTHYDNIGRQGSDIEGFLALDPAVPHAGAVKRREWAPARNRYVRTFTPPRMAKLRFLLDFQRGLVDDLQAGGVRVLLGTDAGAEGTVAGFSALRELELLVASGLSPAEALAAATLEPARFLGLADQVGTVEVGSRADLLLVWGNPLEDVGHLRLQRGVMVGGRWVPRAEQVALLESVRRYQSMAERFLSVLESEGLARAIAAQRAHEAAGGAPLGLWDVNEIGYQRWLWDELPAEGVALFRWNLERHPQSWVAWDALGDGLAAVGERAEAAAAFRRSAALEPRNRAALRRAEELENDPARAPAH